MKLYKFSLITFLAIFFFYDVSAQTAQGGFMLGGSGGFSRTNIKDGNISHPLGGDIISTSLNLRPSASYFILDNLALGISSRVGRSTTRYGEMGSRDRVNYLSVGPVARYFIPMGRWAVFPQVMYLQEFDLGKNYMMSAQQNPPYEYRHRLNAQNLTVALGTTYYISPKVGIEAVISHSFINRRLTFIEGEHMPFSFPEGIQHRLNTLNLNLAVQFYLHKKAQSE